MNTVLKVVGSSDGSGTMVVDTVVKVVGSSDGSEYGIKGSG